MATHIQRRRVQHHVPFPAQRSDQASLYCHQLYQALEHWFLEAIAGDRRFRLDSPNARGIARTPDNILCDIAAALAESVEWDGFMVAEKLSQRGWPADTDLVAAIHRWSCGLKSERIGMAKRHPIPA